LNKGVRRVSHHDRRETVQDVKNEGASFEDAGEGKKSDRPCVGGPVGGENF